MKAIMDKNKVNLEDSLYYVIVRTIIQIRYHIILIASQRFEKCLAWQHLFSSDEDADVTRFDLDEQEVLSNLKYVQIFSLEDEDHVTLAYIHNTIKIFNGISNLVYLLHFWFQEIGGGA